MSGDKMITLEVVDLVLILTGAVLGGVVIVIISKSK